MPRISTRKRATIGLIAVLATLVHGAAFTAVSLAWKLGPYYLAKDQEGLRREFAVKHLEPRREKSIGSWESVHFGDEVASDYAKSRTALLLLGKASLEIHEPDSTRENGGEKAPPDFSFKADSGGTATAITSDGYWLTATHVINQAPDSVQMLKLDENKIPHLHPVRVVWKNESTISKDPDLALLYCPVTSNHFTLPRPGQYSPNAEVLAVGYGAANISEIDSGMAGGKLLKRGPWKGTKGETRWIVYLTDAPLLPGDSGGALLTQEGHLLGINTSIHSSLEARFPQILYSQDWDAFTDYRARVTCPDPAWIRRLIKEDREAQKLARN